MRKARGTTRTIKLRILTKLKASALQKATQQSTEALRRGGQKQQKETRSAAARERVLASPRALPLKSADDLPAGPGKVAALGEPKPTGEPKQHGKAPTESAPTPPSGVDKSRTQSNSGAYSASSAGTVRGFDDQAGKPVFAKPQQNAKPRAPSEDGGTRTHERGRRTRRTTSRTTGTARATLARRTITTSGSTENNRKRAT